MITRFVLNTSLTLAYTSQGIREITGLRISHEFDARNSGNSVNYTNQRVDFKCFKCEKVGHIARNSRSKDSKHGHQSHKQKSSRSTSGQSGKHYQKTFSGKQSRDTRDSFHRNKNRKHKKDVFSVDKDEQCDSESGSERIESDIDSSDSEYAFSVSGNHQRIIVNVNDVPINMIVDSGASCNIINSDIASKLMKRGAKCVQKKTKIYPYGSPVVTSDYYVEGTLTFNNETIDARLVVIEGDNKPLLGKQSAESLGVLKIEINSINSDNIVDKYPNITKKKLGRLENVNVKLHINESVPAVAHKHYRIPFHLRTKVKNELNRLLDEDIIEEVKGPTEWLSPVVVVPKPNSEDIRICVDIRKQNIAIQRTRHVTPTLDELLSNMNNSKVFSKIDLKNGYHQLVLCPESRYITAFSTHMGLYQYKRLAFGINSAAEVFQHTISTLINDIPGARNISDDIIIYDDNKTSHDESLNMVLKRLDENGLTINLSKCEFAVPEIKFFSHKFSSKGLAPDPKKVDALKSFTPPEDGKQLRSFIGMASFSSRFINNYSTITAPLRELMKKSDKWEWTQEHQKSFQNVKDELRECTVMSFYDPKKPTTVVVDGSPFGLGAVLTQVDKPIAYASRFLTTVEQRYSQIELEALAIVFGCDHFHMYLIGCKFRIVTDHKPLLTIWNKLNPPLRIERWGLRLYPTNTPLNMRKVLTT